MTLLRLLGIRGLYLGFRFGFALWHPCDSEDLLGFPSWDQGKGLYLGLFESHASMTLLRVLNWGHSLGSL